MKKLTVTLQQQTPLVHFQHFYSEAGLRATEVKPKLDKFLIENCFGSKVDKCRELFIGYDTEKPDKELKPSFDYSLSIVSSGRDETVKMKRVRKIGEKGFKLKYPMILSNMDGSDKVDLTFHKNIILTFRIKKEQIYDVINERIVEFFALNNFGQRSSKGFGSFIVINIETNGNEGNRVCYLQDFKDCIPDNTLIIHLNSNPLSSRINNTQSALSVNLEELFNYIEYSWKKIKSNAGNARWHNGENVNKGTSSNISFKNITHLIERMPSALIYKPVSTSDDSMDIYLFLNREIPKSIDRLKEEQEKKNKEKDGDESVVERGQFEKYEKVTRYLYDNYFNRQQMKWQYFKKNGGIDVRFSFHKKESK